VYAIRWLSLSTLAESLSPLIASLSFLSPWPAESMVIPSSSAAAAVPSVTLPEVGGRQQQLPLLRVSPRRTAVIGKPLRQPRPQHPLTIS